MSPGNRESAGKRLSGTSKRRTAPAAPKIPCKALYHRVASRGGRKRALVAIARAILVVLYHVLLYQEPYRELGEGYLDERKRVDTAKHLTQRLRKLGYTVTVTAAAA